MAKPELGSKRFCQNKECEVYSYYDFCREPVRCPACGWEYDPETVLKSRRARNVPVEEPKDDSDEIDEDVEDDLDEDEDEDGADEDGGEGSGDGDEVLSDDDAGDEEVPKIDEARLGEGEDDDDLVGDSDLDGSGEPDEEEEDLSY